jgi:hypothetical protein
MNTCLNLHSARYAGTGMQREAAEFHRVFPRRDDSGHAHRRSAAKERLHVARTHDGRGPHPYSGRAAPA